MQHTLTTLQLNIFQKKWRRLQATEILQHTSRVQEYDSVMCGYFCIGLIDFILKGKVC